MGKSQPTYTQEFNQQAVNLFKTSGKNNTQIASDPLRAWGGINAARAIDVS
ncbi:MAG: hypothetical protein PVSMB2_22870 [Ktedonobacteraceae bacterium]